MYSHTLDNITQDVSLFFGILRHTVNILHRKGLLHITIRSDNADWKHTIRTGWIHSVQSCRSVLLVPDPGQIFMDLV
ncbi:hypothetical protein PENTCL1PPCAC_18824 [Pristionchus entomophagus]|uniref:Uncharacterized protein n=1 Tax=Pristionchus entomophagus TaxID=358040 RepID=A0AAV5TQY2_9BILA|nr:hypothetical protein PENTCL1PPCAC_18824 [Pristionchus entomophagus]